MNAENLTLHITQYLALWTHKSTHVFHHANNRYVDLFAKVYFFSHIQQSHFLKHFSNHNMCINVDNKLYSVTKGVCDSHIVKICGITCGVVTMMAPDIPASFIY